jgi:hypothetical protein
MVLGTRAAQPASKEIATEVTDIATEITPLQALL